MTELVPHKTAVVMSVSTELLADTSWPDDLLRRVLSGEVKAGPRPPEPTVEDLYDAWTDDHSPEDWRTFLIATIGDEGWRNIAEQAAADAFKAGYEAGYDRGAWENS